MAENDREFFKLAEVDGEDETSPRIALDPALVAAKLLLMHALSAVALTPEQVGADGFIAVVIVASPDWTKVVRQAWRDLFRQGERWHDAERP